VLIVSACTGPGYKPIKPIPNEPTEYLELREINPDTREWETFSCNTRLDCLERFKLDTETRASLYDAEEQNEAIGAVKWYESITCYDYKCVYKTDSAPWITLTSETCNTDSDCEIYNDNEVLSDYRYKELVKCQSGKCMMHYNYVLTHEGNYVNEKYKQEIPERCQFPAGMDCIDKALVRSEEEDVAIALRNNIGFAIEITEVSTEGASCTVSSAEVALGSEGEYVDLEQGAIHVENNEIFRVKISCDENLVEGEKVKESITVHYTNIETGLNHMAEGEISSVVI